MQGASRRAVQRVVLGAVVAGGLIAVFAEVRAQLAPSEDAAAVLAAQASLGDAIRGGDKSGARRLLSLQFTYVDENGKLYERRPFLDGLKGIAAAAADGAVKIYGGIAVVTGQRKSAQDGDVFFLDIWAKQRGAWRALTMQDVMLAAADAPQAVAAPPNTEAKAAEAKAAETKAAECKNPCQTIPYRVRSAAEQDIVNAFQAIEQQKEDDAVVTVGEVETMRLSVYGDGAAMIATHVVPDNARPPYRAARVWVKRNGQWQMVISAQTDVK